MVTNAQREAARRRIRLRRIHNEERTATWQSLGLEAKRLLADRKQSEYFWYIFHAHPDSDLGKLKARIEATGFWDSFSLRCENYNLGLCSEIFKPLW